MAERGRSLRFSRHPDAQAPNPRSRAPGEQVQIASRPARAGERNGRPGGGRPSSPRSHVSPSQAAAGLQAGGREAGSPSAAAAASPQPCRNEVSPQAATAPARSARALGAAPPARSPPPAPRSGWHGRHARAAASGPPAASSQWARAARRREQVVRTPLLQVTFPASWGLLGWARVGVRVHVESESSAQTPPRVEWLPRVPPLSERCPLPSDEHWRAGSSGFPRKAPGMYFRRPVTSRSAPRLSLSCPWLEWARCEFAFALLPPLQWFDS